MRIAINGFGRIGRSFFRAAFGEPRPEGRAAHGLDEFDIVALNDLTDIKTLGYLLKYDSVYGRYGKPVETPEHALVVAGKEIRVLAEKDPAKLPWRDLDIDIVIESTGFFTDAAHAKAHLDAGAKRVVISAPGKGDVATILVGVNDDRFQNAGPLTCNASCTTNSVAPVMAILMERYGIEKAGMSTIHGYTASQKLVDGPDAKDVRRGRAAAANIVPSTTGAAEAVIQSLPELEGKFDAVAVRVPVIAGSLSIITALLSKPTNEDELNQLFRDAAKDPRWSKILTITEDPVVSTDILNQPFGAIVDLTLTKVIAGNLAKLFSWYDNEAGYTATLVEHVRRVAANL